VAIFFFAWGYFATAHALINITCGEWRREMSEENVADREYMNGSMGTTRHTLNLSKH
jgi:hypothetical protein